MSPELLEFLKLAPLGLIVGAYGTMVGAGGGSVLVPVLLFMYPGQSPATITSMSLAVVFFNAYSGTIAYMRMGRIPYRNAVLYTLVSVPGAVIGALLIHEVPRQIFDPLFGVVLTLIGVALVTRPGGQSAKAEGANADRTRSPSSLTGAIGTAYIAVIASLLGLGGGIVHVPFLIFVMRQTPHTATATSHFVLTFVALAATITHICLGEFQSELTQTMYLAVGVMMGAPLGAALSGRLRGSLIIRSLAIALCVVGVRLLLKAFGH